MSSITYTTRSKERNPSKNPEKELNSLAVVSGRLLGQLIREQRIGVSSEVCLSLTTTYDGDIMENVVSFKVKG